MPPKKIGQILVDNKIITKAQLSEGLKVQKKKGGLLGIILVEMGHLNPKLLADFIEKQKYS